MRQRPEVGERRVSCSHYAHCRDGKDDDEDHDCWLPSRSQWPNRLRASTIRESQSIGVSREDGSLVQMRTMRENSPEVWTKGSTGWSTHWVGIGSVFVSPNGPYTVHFIERTTRTVEPPFRLLERARRALKWRVMRKLPSEGTTLVTVAVVAIEAARGSVPNIDHLPITANSAHIT